MIILKPRKLKTSIHYLTIKTKLSSIMKAFISLTATLLFILVLSSCNRHTSSHRNSTCPAFSSTEGPSLDISDEMQVQVNELKEEEV